MSIDEETPLLRGLPGSHDAGKMSPILCNANDSEVSREAEQPPDASNSTLPGEPDSEILKPQASMAAIMVPISIGLFLAALDWTIVASSYASIGSELQQLQSTSWIATAYMLTTTSFQPLYGKLSDIYGRKNCLIIAYAIFALGCLFCGLARNMTELISARAFAGIGGGGMTTLASIIMSDVAPLRQRGTWQGIGNIVFATGQAAGAPLGGFLADTIGWRWAFLLQVPLTILAILSVSLALNIPKAQASDFIGKLKRVDFLGAITLVSAVFCLLFGLDRGGNVSWQDHTTIGCLTAFAVLFLMFVFIELEIANEPFAPKRIVINPSLLASYLCNFFALGAAMSSTFHVSLYFQAVKGRTATQAGLVLLPAIIAGVPGSLGSGLVMQSTGKYYALTLGVFTLGLLGSLTVVIMTGVLTYSYIGVTIGLAISSLGVGAGITTTLISLIANAGPEDQAIATAVSYLFRSLGSVVWLSVASTFVQHTLREKLSHRLSGEHVDEIIERVRRSLAYIGELEPTVRSKVIDSYADAVHGALWLCVLLSTCAVISSFFIKEKPLTR